MNLRLINIFRFLISLVLISCLVLIIFDPIKTCDESIDELFELSYSKNQLVNPEGLWSLIEGEYSSILENDCLELVIKMDTTVVREKIDFINYLIEIKKTLNSYGGCEKVINEFGHFSGNIGGGGDALDELYSFSNLTHKPNGIIGQVDIGLRILNNSRNLNFENFIFKDAFFKEISKLAKELDSEISQLDFRQDDDKSIENECCQFLKNINESVPSGKSCYEKTRDVLFYLGAGYCLSCNINAISSRVDNEMTKNDLNNLAITINSKLREFQDSKKDKLFDKTIKGIKSVIEVFK